MPLFQDSNQYREPGFNTCAHYRSVPLFRASGAAKKKNRARPREGAQLRPGYTPLDKMDQAPHYDSRVKAARLNFPWWATTLHSRTPRGPKTRVGKAIYKEEPTGHQGETSARRIGLELHSQLCRRQEFILRTARVLLKNSPGVALCESKLLTGVEQSVGANPHRTHRGTFSFIRTFALC